MPVVDLGAAAEPHAAVERACHQDDVTGLVARGVERFRLAVSLVVVVGLLLLMLTGLVDSDVVTPVCRSRTSNKANSQSPRDLPKSFDKKAVK